MNAVQDQGTVKCIGQALESSVILQEGDRSISINLCK